MKPDVVEYGGDWTHDGNDPPQLLISRDSCPDLVRATLGGGPPHDRDAVGTSFAAPKVARLAAALQKLLPDEPCMLYRALIAQSARWPRWAESEAGLDAFKRIGYGIPDFDRATSNSPYRVTMITSGLTTLTSANAHVYSVPIPPELRAPQLAQRIRIDVTLSYAARPRRTRNSLKQYVSTWLSWDVSKVGETPDSFSSRVLLDEGDGHEADGEDIFPWVLRERDNWGSVRGANRNSATLQKDWAIVRAHQLPPTFCIAVIGHKGWAENEGNAAKYALAVSIQAIDEDLLVYEPIRLGLELPVRVRV